MTATIPIFTCAKCGFFYPVRLWPFRCRCGRKHHSTKEGDYIDREPMSLANPPKADPLPRGYVGSELMELFGGLGFTPDKCGGKCREMAIKMNAWGREGCRGEHREEILTHLKTAYSKLTYADVVNAAASSVWSGMALRIDLGDWFGSLLDEAIRRATAPDSGS